MPESSRMPRRLDGAARHDDQVGVHRVQIALGIDVLDAGRPSSVCDDPADVRLRHELGPAGGHRLGQQRHGVALGVDGAAEERAVAAVVAGRPAVVCDAVGRRRRLVGMQADLSRGLRGQEGAVHRRPRRHRIGTRAPGGERVRALPPGHADRPLDLGVVRLHLVVVEWPVVDGRILLGAVRREEAEVLLAKARDLAVGMGAPASYRRRNGVHLADVGVLTLVRGAAERTRLDEWVGAEEVAGDELDLVVRVVTRRLRQIVGVEQVVATLLHDHHRPPGTRQHLGRRGAAGSRPDDDGVWRHVAHGWETSASL